MGVEQAKVDQKKLEELVGRIVAELGASISALLVHIGDKLGFYKTLAASGPSTPAELAARTGTAERYVREWLSNQAAGGYVTYDIDTGRFRLNAEQQLCLAEEGSPAFVAGGFESLAAAFVDEPKITAAFRSGNGVGWHEHDARLFSGTERFFRPAYNANLVASWIPALEGFDRRLREGAKVADVGCGHGASTLVLAAAYPRSTVFGFDFHAPSVERARVAAREQGLSERAHFDRAGAKDFPGGGYDLVAFFDCLHDMGDPIGALRHVREALSDDGAVMLVEPFANDSLEDNLNPVGRIFYGFSTVVCCPASMAQEVGLALGAQAGEKRLRGLFTEAGFTRFRRATQTPFNIVFEARP